MLLTKSQRLEPKAVHTEKRNKYLEDLKVSLCFL